MSYRRPQSILTEVQRDEIRRGWYPSNQAQPYPGELEAEHAWRIAQRALAMDLPINHRPSLLEVAQRPPGPEEAQVLVGVPAKDVGMAPGTAWDVEPEEVVAADEAVAGKVGRSRGWFRQGRSPANSPRRARFGHGHRYLH